jgi:hypothetical protein
MQAVDIIRINVNGSIYTIPRSFILEKEPGSLFIQDYHLLNQQDALYYYGDNNSFEYIYEYFCGYDIDCESMNKQDLINLLSDCNFYQLSEFKKKLQKYIIINPNYDQQEQKIKEAISYVRSIYSTLRPMINNVIPKVDGINIDHVVSVILNDDKAITYMVKFYLETPKYEFITQDTPIGNLLKYFQRTITLTVSHHIYKYVQETYGDVYAKMLENTFPEYFKKVDEPEKNWYNSVVSSMSTIWSGLFTPKQTDTPRQTDSLHDLLSSIMDSSADKDKYLKNALKMLNIEDLLKTARNTSNESLKKPETKKQDSNINLENVIDSVIKNLINELVSGQNINNTVSTSENEDDTASNYRGSTPNSLPDLVSDSESSSDEYEKISSKDL